MKKIIIISVFFLLLIVNRSSATNYFVKNSGFDSANGLSDTTAWATLEKVRSFTFAPGDHIYFKRGDVWRTVEELDQELTFENGTAGSTIEIGSYGTEPEKPYIIGSISKSDVSDWTNTSGNLWRTPLPSYRSPTQVVFNFWASPTQAIPGTRSWFGETYATRATDPNAQGEWEFDTYLYIYSVGNPATFYPSIEVVVDPTDWSTNDDIMSPGAYNTIDGLAMGLSSRHGFSISDDGVTVRNCDVFFCGKQRWVWNADAGDYLLNGIGNGVEFWQPSGQTVSDGIVEKNRIWQCFDAGMTNQGNTGIGSNIVYKNNIVFKCEYGFEIWVDSPLINTNIYLLNNTFAYNGYGWGHNRGIPPGGTSTRGLDIAFFRNTSGFIVKNNIFYKPRWCSSATEFDDLPAIDLDYNCYYAPDAPLLFRDGMYSLSGYTPAQWSTFKSEQGKEAHGIYSDPLFVDPENDDFNLSVSSPCVNIGSDIGVTDDFNSETRDSQPDIGAIELITSAYAVMTATGIADENSIVDGDGYFDFAVSNDTFKTLDSSIKADIRAGLDSNQTGLTGWDQIVKPLITDDLINLIDSTHLRIGPLAPAVGYDISVYDTITGNLPASCLNGGQAVTAVPSINIQPYYNPTLQTISFGVGGGTVSFGGSGKDSITLQEQ